MAGSEAAGAGARLRCAQCGTELHLRQLGGGRIECCGTTMEVAQEPGRAARSGGGAPRVRCDGCGNEAVVERRGQGSPECCNEEMTLV